MQSVMDRLIPAINELPGAGAMGLFTEVERMAGQHDRYGQALMHFLEALADTLPVESNGGFPTLDGEAQDQLLRKVENALPEDFATVLEIVYLAYYSAPQVHARIGWRSGPLQPAGFSLPPFDESILDTARKREPFWRKA